MDFGDEFVVLPPDEVFEADGQGSRFINGLHFEYDANGFDGAVESGLEVAEGAGVDKALGRLLQGFLGEVVSNLQSGGGLEVGLRIWHCAVEDDLRCGVLGQCVERSQAEKGRCKEKSSEGSH